MAAPTKYKQEFCEDIIKFFTVKLTKIENKKTVPNEIPFFSAYARKIQVNMDSLTEWRKRHDEFSVAYAHCKQLQKDMIIQGGMRGLYNPQFTIFAAKNITDMTDQKEIKMSGALDLGKITDDELTRELKSLESNQEAKGAQTPIDEGTGKT